MIGAIQSHPPDLVTAQRNFDDDLQHCLAGEFVPEDQLPPGETLERFCADNVRFENYVNNSLRLAELSNILKGTSFILIVLGLVIGASSVGADWQAGTMAALLTWEPRRVRIFLVRAAVVLGSVFVLAVALQCVLALEFAAAAALRGTTVGTGESVVARRRGHRARGSGWPPRSAPALGVTLAMIGRNTAAALGVAFGYLAIVESLLRGFIPKISPLPHQHEPRGIRRRPGRTIGYGKLDRGGRRVDHDHDLRGGLAARRARAVPHARRHLTHRPRSSDRHDLVTYSTPFEHL